MSTYKSSNIPTECRRRKIPHCIDDGAAATFPDTVEDHYRAIYFEAFDLITSCISNRFNQPGYKTYGKVQALLLKPATSQPYGEESRHLLSFYGSDFDSSLFSTHLKIFSESFRQTNKFLFLIFLPSFSLVLLVKSSLCIK